MNDMYVLLFFSALKQADMNYNNFICSGTVLPFRPQCKPCYELTSAVSFPVMNLCLSRPSELACSMFPSIKLNFLATFLGTFLFSLSSEPLSIRWALMVHVTYSRSECRETCVCTLSVVPG